jgi:hypothetical protein
LKEASSTSIKPSRITSRRISDPFFFSSSTPFALSH